MDKSCGFCPSASMKREQTWKQKTDSPWEGPQQLLVSWVQRALQSAGNWLLKTSFPKEVLSTDWVVNHADPCSHVWFVTITKNTTELAGWEEKAEILLYNMAEAEDY